MFTDEDAVRLVEEAKTMARELREMAEGDEDAGKRERAARWLATIRRFGDYALECRDRARGRR